MATIYPLPIEQHQTINIKKYAYDELTEYVEERTIHYYESICRTCSDHRAKLSVFFMIIIIAGISIYTVMTNNSIVVPPCSAYGSDTLAKDVSIVCLKYLWTQNKCQGVIDSSPTWMWWLQSPQGLTTVKCNNINTGINCGAGSYNTIRVYTQLCNPYYRG